MQQKQTKKKQKHLTKAIEHQTVERDGQHLKKKKMIIESEIGKKKLLCAIQLYAKRKKQIMKINRGELNCFVLTLKSIIYLDTHN